MTFIAVRCPHCQSDPIVKRGKTTRGTQRYLCRNALYVKRSFLLDYRNRGCLPEVKQLIIDMSLNASGIRDTARSLHVCTNTVLSELKKKEAGLEPVDTALLRTLHPDDLTVHIERAGEAERDERWSFVGNKHNPRWLWQAIDPQTGKVLANVFGRRKDEIFLKLQALLEPFGLTHYYTDKWEAYTHHLEPEQHSVSKRGTQKSERQHLMLVSALRDHQIEVVGPLSNSASRQSREGQGHDVHSFAIDWEAEQATCPQGHRSVKWSPWHSQEGHAVIRIRFAKAICDACEVRPARTSSAKYPRQFTVRPQTQHEAIQVAHERQEMPESKTQYALRAGVESSLSQGVRRFDLRRSRYIGLARTHLQQTINATAMHLVRLADWFRKGKLVSRAPPPPK